MQHVPLCLCSLLAANSQFSIPIGQKMQLTGCDNANYVRNATCADTQTSIEWPYCTFPILFKAFQTGSSQLETLETGSSFLANHTQPNK